MSATPETLF